MPLEQKHDKIKVTKAKEATWSGGLVRTHIKCNVCNLCCRQQINHDSSSLVTSV